jgi:undecaprenyl diphosphate synthase
MKQLIKWIKDLFIPASEEQVELDEEKIPEHIAIIMDGNGRWAKERGLPRTAGHKTGVDTLREIVNLAQKLGVKYITAYAFSTENWKRPQQEVDFLMGLFEETFAKEMENFDEKNIKVNIIGYKGRLPESVRDKSKKIMEKTKGNDGLTVNIALDYGARSEIIEGIRSLAADVQREDKSPEEIEEEDFTATLYTAGQPDPDLFIRPGGERRISNFLLWQLAYTELFFTDIYWPEFDEVNLRAAIKEYQRRERRFGGLKGK